MDWKAAFASQREQVRTQINQRMNSDAVKVRPDGEMTIDKILSLKTLFEDFLRSWKNGLLHMQLLIDKRVSFSKTTPCHFKIFTGVLLKDVRNIAYLLGYLLFLRWKVISGFMDTTRRPCQASSNWSFSYHIVFPSKY